MARILGVRSIQQWIISETKKEMKTAAYIIMLALCAGIVVMNYKLNGQPRKEQVYNWKKGLWSAIIIAVLTSLIYWL